MNQLPLRLRSSLNLRPKHFLIPTHFVLFFLYLKILVYIYLANETYCLTRAWSSFMQICFYLELSLFKKKNVWCASMSCLVKITKCTSELLSEELFVGFDFKNSTVQNRVKWTIQHNQIHISLVQCTPGQQNIYENYII